MSLRNVIGIAAGFAHRSPILLILTTALALGLASPSASAQTTSSPGGYDVTNLYVYKAGTPLPTPMPVRIRTGDDLSPPPVSTPDPSQKLSATQQAYWLASAADKYAGYKYTLDPNHPPTNTQDCAGFVIDQLFHTGPYSVNADTFYNFLVAPGSGAVEKTRYIFGYDNTDYSSVKKNDVVVYIKDDTGGIGHIAIVTDVTNGVVTIETKDFNEAAYTTTLPPAPDDPLIVNYGKLHIYTLDPGLSVSVKGPPQSTTGHLLTAEATRAAEDCPVRPAHRQATPARPHQAPPSRPAKWTMGHLLAAGPRWRMAIRRPASRIRRETTQARPPQSPHRHAKSRGIR